MGDAENPKLAGLDEAYFVEQMQAFKSGTRKDEGDTMAMYAENLSLKFPLDERKEPV
jgi:cytochrome c553